MKDWKYTRSAGLHPGQSTKKSAYLESRGNHAEPGSRQLERDSLVDIRVRHHEHRPLQVQSALLKHALRGNASIAGTSLSFQDSPATHMLDLTSFAPSASLIFLFWLFNRRLPTLVHDCRLTTDDLDMKFHEDDEEEEEASRAAMVVEERQTQEAFDIGLVEAWMLGAAIGASGFMNDTMEKLAERLERAENSAQRTTTPTYSSAIAWARAAYVRGAPPSGSDARTAKSAIQDFAVDVAARRVWDVGMKGLSLTTSERSDLSSSRDFAADVFGAVGGHIGTRGVRVRDLMSQYLVA